MRAASLLPAPPPAATATFDWNDAHARLDRLGAVRFVSERLANGGFRVTFQLPQGPIEVVSATEAGAVLEALAQAETAPRR